MSRGANRYCSQMTQKPNLTVIILTFNEAKHIARCIQSIATVAREIVLVDSYSTDDTVTQAYALGARVFRNRFVNHAEQLNWALDNVSIQTDWVMRLDADEYLSDELIDELREQLPHISAEVSGLTLRIQVQFMGRGILYGGFGKFDVLRIWRNGVGRCERRWMDEHIVLSGGKTQELQCDLIHDNLNNISWWTQKHLQYASREAIELLNLRYDFQRKDPGGQPALRRAAFKRWLKERVYSRLPVLLRPVLYYFYRMIVLGGALDGPRGWLFHFLQGFWYRLLVDIKVMEVERRMAREGILAVEAIRREFGIDPLLMESNK